MTRKGKMEYIRQIPAGKIYLSNPSKLLPQPAQKGPVCWYYALNYLRKRYGKGYRDCPERRIEKKIAAFRNTLISIDTEYNRLHRLAQEENLASVDATRSPLRSNGALDFQEKLDNIRAYIDFINSMSDTRITDYIEPKPSDFKVNALYNKYDRMARQLIVKAYGLDYDTSDAHLDFAKLIDLIKLRGPLACIGKLGEGYLKHPEQFDNCAVGSHRLRFFQDENCDETRACNHMVVLIGGRRDATGCEFVYFIDPNVGSENRFFYAIPFKSFQRLIRPSCGNAYLILPHPEHNLAAKLHHASQMEINASRIHPS